MQVYIHIPFCDLKCKYCRFASIGKIQNLHIDKYVSFLCREILELKYNGKQIETIYFGGGTPSILNEKKLKEIFKALKQNFIFSEDIEITIEATPNNITKQNLEIWKSFGINRISIGIQTLNQKSLEEIGRGEKGDILDALENLKNFKKIENISIDFIIGLPYVRHGEILENIKYILEKYDFIKHISVYMLEDYYNPDKVIETKFDNITYPKDWKKLGLKDKDYLKEYSSIKEYLLENGFINYEISNFAKPGFLCKHNKGYWEHREVLGFGLGAYSFINRTRRTNSDNFADYYTGKKLFEEKLSDYDVFLEKVMFGLRTSGLKKEIYEKLDLEKIDYFIENGYLKKESEKLVLTDSGVLVLDHILKEII